MVGRWLHGAARAPLALEGLEALQARNEPLPDYRLVGTLGPDHRKLFEVEVAVRDEALARGTGPSKKEAEQEAARLAIQKLGGEAE